MQSLPTNIFRPTTLALLAIIVLCGCGTPATGPLERGGDAARRELRDYARGWGADVSNDTSWLDALILVDFRGLDHQGLNLEVHLTDEGGHIYRPIASIAGQTLTVDYSLLKPWPVAQTNVPLADAAGNSLVLDFVSQQAAIPITWLDAAFFSAADSAGVVLYDAVSDSILLYSSKWVADSIECSIRVLDSTQQTVFYQSWKQADNGALNIPLHIRQQISSTGNADIDITRTLYQVQITSSGKKVGSLQTTSQLLFLYPPE